MAASEASREAAQLEKLNKDLSDPTDTPTVTAQNSKGHVQQKDQ